MLDLRHSCVAMEELECCPVSTHDVTLELYHRYRCIYSYSYVPGLKYKAELILTY